MDCRKRTRLRDSASVEPATVEPSPMGSQSQSGALIRPLKLPARVLPALLPAIVLVCFVFVAFRTVHGQAPQEIQAAEVQQLIEQLTQADFDLREAAERQLIEIGSPVVDPLVSTLLNCKPDVCSRVKRILQTVAEECDEESLFKVLAALRIRFEIPAERTKALLDRWTIQSRNAVVARWRQQGAIVTGPFDGMAPMAPQIFRFEVAADEAGIVKVQSKVPDKEVEKQSIAERLRLVLEGSLEQNKRLVLDTKKEAAGFEKSLNMLQQQPVSVTIGEDWRGDYSDFDFSGARSTLPIRSLEIRKKAISDSLLSVLNKHPLGSLTLNECTVAADVKETFPVGLSMLVIEGSEDPIELCELISSENSVLSRVRFVGSKFGKAQAIVLSEFKLLATIELVRIDLEKDAFEGLALLRWLRRVDIERCKFPAAAFLEFQQERPAVGMVFTAKAFLGVSSDPGIMGGRGRPLQMAIDGRLVQPQQAAPTGCVIATVVPGEAADRAGMKAGDEVVSVSGRKVKSFDELRIAIAQCEIGEEVSIEIRRDGEEKTLKATMGIPDDLK